MKLAFQFTSQPAKDVCEAAIMLLDWAKIPENLPVITNFSPALHEQFKSCLKHLNLGSVNRQKLWRSFFGVGHLKSSQNYGRSSFLRQV